MSGPTSGRAGGAKAFFGLPLDGLTGRREPLEALGFVAASELGERIGQAGGLAERVELLERFVAGYYDQAHLIGEARRLGGALPAHLARG